MAEGGRPYVRVADAQPHNLPQRPEQPLHFLHRVVVHQADAQKSSQALDVQLFGQVQGIVVSVPGEEAALAELRCELQRRVAFDADGERRATILEAPRVADAVELQSGNRKQACDHLLHHLALMPMDRFVRGQDRGAPGGDRGLARAGRVLPSNPRRL